MANRQTNGIHWNGRVYTRLSGPISMSYLHPPSNHPELPLVLLFGDEHGTDFPCSPCTPSSGCLSVTDNPFFQELDELAREMPIDVFTETIWNQTPNENEKEVLFHQFVKKTQQCYTVTRRSIQSSPCPTQFVRWHHVDTRLMADTQYIEWHMGRVLQFIQKVNRTSQAKPYEFVYPTFSFPKSTSSNKWMDMEIEIGVEFIHILFQPHKSREEITREIVNLLFSYIEKYPSMIRKELEKQSIIEIGALKETLVRILFTSTHYTEGVEQIIKFLELDQALLFVFRDILLGMFQTKGIAYRYPHEKRTPAIKANIDIINDVITYVYHIIIFSTASLLDVYAVARMVKKPQGNDRGILHIGYYGNRHCMAIRDILVTLLNYSVQADYPVQTDDNCIVFQHPLYIERDMENLAMSRYQRYPELREEYRGTIARESQGRLEHSQGGRKKVRRHHTYRKRCKKHTRRKRI